MAIRRFGNVLAACFFLLTGCHSSEWDEEPKLFAHRGASDRFNESTLTAYQVAAREGVDALEMDLRMTADGELVIMHDETIDRTTSGSGFVEQYTFAEIAAYPTVGMSGREAVPRLRDLLEKFGTSEHYYIETRLVNGEAKMEAPLIELLAEYGLMEQKTGVHSVVFHPKPAPRSRACPGDSAHPAVRQGKDELDRSGVSNVRPDWD